MNSESELDYAQQSSTFKQVKGKIMQQHGQLPQQQGLWLSEQIRFRDKKVAIQLDVNQHYRPRVQKIYPCPKSTYVVLFKDMTDKISHVDSNGKQIKSFHAQKYVSKIQMIEPTVVIAIVCDQKWNQQLLQWNIQSNEQVFVPLPYDSQGARLQLFKQSKAVCLIYVQAEKRQKWGRRDVLKRQKFRILLFQLPLQSKLDAASQQSKYAVKKQVLYSNMNIVKIDNVSKLALIPKQLVHETEPMIVIFDNITKQWRQLYLKNVINPCPKLCSLYINKIWEFEPGILYINTRTQVDIYNKLKHRNQVDQQLQDIQKNYAYILDYQHDSMRPTKFTITQDHQVHILGGIQQKRKAIRKRLDIHGRYMEAYTEYQGDYDLIALPLFYIDIQNQRILAIDRPKYNHKQSLNNYKCETIPYAPTVQFCYVTDYNGGTQIVIRSIDYVRFKLDMIGTSILEHLLANWDNDLLMSVAQLLCPST